MYSHDSEGLILLIPMLLLIGIIWCGKYLLRKIGVDISIGSLEIFSRLIDFLVDLLIWVVIIGLLILSYGYAVLSVLPENLKDIASGNFYEVDWVMFIFSIILAISLVYAMTRNIVLLAREVLRCLKGKQ